MPPKTIAASLLGTTIRRPANGLWRCERLCVGFSTSSSSSSSWDEMFQRLQSFYKTTTAARTTPLLLANLDPSLLRWIQNQRISYARFLRKQKPTTPSVKLLQRWEKLKSIDFPFTVQDEEWEARFHQLVQFQNQFGHVNVSSSQVGPNDLSSSNEVHQELRQFVKLQRVYKRKKDQNMSTPLTDEREKRLTDLGFEWSIVHPRDFFLDKVPWLHKYHQLTSLLASKQNNVSSSLFYEYPSLMRWIKRQHKDKHILTEEKLKLLDAINFFTDDIFAAPKSYKKWNVMFHELQTFHRLHGHCRVPQTFVTEGEPSRNLGLWVRSQRTQYRLYLKGFTTALNTQRIELLDGIDFEWRVYGKRDKKKRTSTMDSSKNKKVGQEDPSTIRDESTKMIHLLKDFQSKHGHIFVPTSYSSSAASPPHIKNDDLSALSQWLQKKRLAYHQQHQSKHQGDEPEQVTLKLAALSLTERNLLNNGSDLHISEDEIQSLNELGFVWSLEEAKWWETYHKLESSQMRGLPKNVQVQLSKKMLDSRTRHSQGEDGTLPPPLTITTTVPGAESMAESRFDPIANMDGTTRNGKNDHVEDSSDDLEESSIDLLMTPAQQKWFKMFEALKKVRSYDSISDPTLKEWVQEQRQRYRKKQWEDTGSGRSRAKANGNVKTTANEVDHLTDEEILALESISFPWDIETSTTKM